MISASRKCNDVSGLYQALVQHKIHQDQLLWSRIQTINAIQGGFILLTCYFYFVWEPSLPLLGGWLLIGAGVLTGLLFFIILGDYADMKVNDTIMNRLANRLLRQLGIAGKVNWTDEHVWHRSFLRGLFKGHHMVYVMVIMFVALDFVFGTLLLCGVY